MSPNQVASDWITYARYDALAAPDDVHERGWVLYEWARTEPTLAWEAIKEVIARYSEADLFSAVDTEAKNVLGNTAAGPLEDLLAEHGPSVIDTVETEAQQDRRMFWVLGCVWRNSMTDEVWERVQRAAGKISR
jgi:hypothetical protein